MMTKVSILLPLAWPWRFGLRASYSIFPIISCVNANPGTNSLLCIDNRIGFDNCLFGGAAMKLLPFMVLSLSFPSLADYATQTDWSGGPGVWGPVIDWGDECYLTTDMDYYSTSGEVGIKTSVIEHFIVKYPSVTCVDAADINGDGYQDVLACAGQFNDSILWLWNLDGSGTSWDYHWIGTSFRGASCVRPCDLDGDGDVDVIGSAYDENLVAWFENTDGTGVFWTEHEIDADFPGAYSVYPGDIDGDGDMDVVGVAFDADRVVWWENADGAGGSWVEHTIEQVFGGPLYVHSSDIDGDGDLDVLASTDAGDDLTWWENADGAGTFWVKHRVDENYYDYAVCLSTDDVDGDGDMDILGADYGDWAIKWWENLDGVGTSWLEHTVDDRFDGAYSVRTADFDGDGDVDVLGAGYGADEVAWWENIDSIGTTWMKHQIAELFYNASTCCADIDGNGNPDAVGAANYTGYVNWWDLSQRCPSGSVESSILDARCSPDWENLYWSCSEPESTSIAFQVRASSDPDNMGPWSDTLAAPCGLEGILEDGDSLLQYRAILETSDTEVTPRLFDVAVIWNSLGIEGECQSDRPRLLRFTPNPTVGTPVARFFLPEPSNVGFSVYDLAGRLVITVPQREYQAGSGEVELAATPPGVYFCRMRSAGFDLVRRFCVLE
ncbi:T9SS type A sorting domain-containing protein [Candidatus Fermentibacteria bacterium]|nr:T9SS type A sorting domain-containing protein [Candidatus Fermentibacteria bacterium]